MNDTAKLKTMRILYRSFGSIDNYSKMDISSYGLNQNEFAALEALYNHGKMTTASICQKVLIPNSSMTYVLDKLESKKIIKRTQDLFDKRTYYVELSETGLKLSNELMPKHYHQMMKIFDDLTEDETNQLNELLKKIGYKAKMLGSDF